MRGRLQDAWQAPIAYCLLPIGGHVRAFRVFRGESLALIADCQLPIAD
jgi:hypothetical protein